MDTRKAAQDLVDEWAAQLELPGLAFDDDGIIDLQLDESQMLSLAVDPQAEAIAVNSPLRFPASLLTTGLWRRVLATNTKLFEEDGPSLAIAAETGGLVLQQSLPLTGLSYPRFERRLTRFLEVFEGIEQKLLEIAGPDVATDAELPAAHVRP